MSREKTITDLAQGLPPYTWGGDTTPEKKPATTNTSGDIARLAASYPSVLANTERLPDYEALYDEFNGDIQVRVGGVPGEGNMDLTLDQARDFRDQLDTAITEAESRDSNEGTDQ